MEPEPLTGADVLELLSEDTPGFWDVLEEPNDSPPTSSRS